MVSDKKKNPSLGSIKEGWNIRFISNFAYLLDPS